MYVADQLSYVVQKFSATGAFETEWGSYGGGHGQFGPIGGLATDAAGNVYVVDSSHNRIEKFDPNGNFILQWGHKGSEPGDFNFGSSQDYTKPPGGGVAVAGSYVYVADSGNNRIERFNLEGGEPMEWGTKGSGPGQFSYPRGVAANESEVLVADDDNHRIEKFAPEGAYQSSAGSQGTGPGQFGFPYGVALDAAGNVYVADDLNHRIVKLTPALAFAGAWGGYGGKPGQLAFPRALASDPAGDTYVANTANDRIEVYNPEGRFVRTIGISARDPNAFTAPRGVAIDPTGRLLVSDTDGNRIELFSPESDAFAGSMDHGRRAQRPVRKAHRHRHRTTWLRARRRRRQRTDRAPVGRRNLFSELGGPTGIGGAQLNGADAVAFATQSGRTFVADAGHNRVLVYGAEGSLIARWGAGGGNGSASSASGGFNHPSGIAVSPAAFGEDVYVADKGNDRIVELAQSGEVLRQWGGRGSGDGRFHAPSGVAVDGAGTCMRSTAKTIASRCSTPRAAIWPSGACAAPASATSPNLRAIAVDCAGDVYVADTNNNRVERFNLAEPAASGCLAPGSWPPPLDVPPVLHVAVARRSGVLARARADAQRELPARLQGAGDRHAVAGRPRAARWRSSRPRASRAELVGRAPAAAPRAARAAPAAPRARAGSRPDRARAHRRGRADRPGERPLTNLLRAPITSI